jgi:hypothetical protein
MPMRMLPDHPHQTMLFVEVERDISVRVGVASKERDVQKTRAMPPGKYLAEVDAACFAIGMVLTDLPSILSKTNHRSAEMVTKSRLALAEIQDPRR